MLYTRLATYLMCIQLVANNVVHQVSNLLDVYATSPRLKNPAQPSSPNPSRTLETHKHTLPLPDHICSQLLKRISLTAPPDLPLHCRPTAPAHPRSRASKSIYRK